MGQKLGILLLAALVVAQGLKAEVDLRLASPSYAFLRGSFKADNGAQYDLTQQVIEGDLLALEWRGEHKRGLGIGTAIVARYSKAELVSLDQGKTASGTTITYKQASYSYTALAPALLVTLFPWPDLRPLEPFLEGRVEILAFYENTLVSAGAERFRPVLQVGVRSAPNDTGYYWGARIHAAKRGFSGDFAGVTLPDDVMFGLQVDWIGLQL